MFSFGRNDWGTLGLGDVTSRFGLDSYLPESLAGTLQRRSASPCQQCQQFWCLLEGCRRLSLVLLNSRLSLTTIFLKETTGRCTVLAGVMVISQIKAVFRFKFRLFPEGMLGLGDNSQRSTPTRVSIASVVSVQSSNENGIAIGTPFCNCLFLT